MILFKKLVYRNLLGAGNAPIEIILDKSQTTLVIGTNGAGKSSFMDALTFVLFGKPFRDIKKAQLINTINGKQCLVEVWFEIGMKKYYIKRGIKPDVFEIYCDDKLIDQTGDSRDYQRMLEEQILCMNAKTFGQVVLLSVANFKPFMQLDAKERRDVIEDILDIRVFTYMNMVLKGKQSALKESINIADGNIEVQKQKIEVQKSYIEQLNRDQANRASELTDAINQAIEVSTNLNERIETLRTEASALDETVSDATALSEKQRNLMPIMSQLNGKLKTLTETVDFYQDSDVCPTCTQPITEEVKIGSIDTANAKIVEINKGIERLNNQLEAIATREKEISAVRVQINNINREIQSMMNQLTVEQTMIAKLNRELASLTQSVGNIDVEKDKLKTMADSALSMVKQKSELSESKQYLDIAAMLLKDNGIKTRIIEQYLPVINKFINRYLGAMDTWISFHLDGEFNETIKSRYRDTFTYNSFSEGEKQRIDLAILFTWRAVAKMKNSVSCNLLVFDEILDKCLDDQGTEYVVQLLETLGAGTNVFVISHKVRELQDKFHSVIKFDKVNNFSKII